MVDDDLAACLTSSEVLVKVLSGLENTDALQGHYNKTLFTALDEVIDLAHMLEPLTVFEGFVLGDEMVLLFLFLLHFQSHVFLEGLVVGQVSGAESSAAQFLFLVEVFRNFGCVFQV